MSHITFERFDQLRPVLLNYILELEKKVFSKPMPEEKISRELMTKHNVSIFIAFLGGIPVGYKVGFEKSKRVYYSWIGGVDPSFREKGVAKELMKLQHDHITSLGYEVVCTKTDNRFKPMIILNLKSGFEIRGTIQDIGEQHISILMEKSLL